MEVYAAQSTETQTRQFRRGLRIDKDLLPLPSATIKIPMNTAILDTNIYIGHWERGLYEEELDAVRYAYIIRYSAVVLSELRRGACTRQAERLVASLFRLATVRWEPTSADWWEAGRLIRKVGDRYGWDRTKRRSFQNDVLIALTARRHGATIVTANLSDFNLLAQELHIHILEVR